MILFCWATSLPEPPDWVRQLLLLPLAGVIAERGGLYNIGLEGQILDGALGAAAGSFATGSAMIGLGCGIICGLISGLLLGYMSIRLRINQLVGGIALSPPSDVCGLWVL